MYRDYNAALNILDAAGLAESLNAHGDGIRLLLASAKRSSRQGSANPTGGTLARSALGIPVLKHREEVNGADRLSIACPETICYVPEAGKDNRHQFLAWRLRPLGRRGNARLRLSHSIVL